MVRPQAAHDVLDLVKLLYVRHCGLCCLHAASAAWNGLGLVFAGPSGCGKTTTVLSLVRDGFTLLSDELTLIDLHGTGEPQLRGLLMAPMLVGEASGSLEDLEATLTVDGQCRKTPFKLAQAEIRASRNLAVRPRLVVHLQAKGGSRRGHELSALSAQAAFALMSRQVLDLPGPDRLDIQFESLSALADCARHYRMSLGTDLASLPGLMRDLLAEH